MSNTGYKGLNDAPAAGSEFNALSFLIERIVGRHSTATLVQIKSVTNNGGVSPVGYVDVQPLVAQLDGHGNAVAHGVIHNIPYFRLQGGTDAVIIDPKQNDIGICIFADRDISSVKNAKGAATPGSRRRFDMADGLYLGGVLNGTPQQYIQFTAGGITVSSPTLITLTAPSVQINSTVTVTGDLTANGTSVHNHTHSDPQGGNTGKPN